MVRSGSSSMAPKRKHSPPTNVPKFTSTMFRGRPVVGTTNVWNGRDAEGERTDQVEGRDPPGQAAQPPAGEGVTHLKPREPARHEKAHRTERVGRPNETVKLPD